MSRWRTSLAMMSLKSAIFASSSVASSMTQLHRQDRVGLDVVDLEEILQALTGLVDRRRAADQRDDLVERVEGLEVAAQDVHALFRLAQAELRAPHDDLELVRDPQRDEAVERQRARHAVDDREHVRGEVRLQVGVLVEVVEHDLRDGVALEHDDEPLSGAARGLVADVGDALHASVARELRDLHREVVGVDLVRQLRDDEAGAALDLLDVHDGAHRDGSAARAVRLLDPLVAEDQRLRREVGSGDPLHETREELVARHLGVVERPEGAVGDLAQVVRRDVRRHADGDTDGSVDQEVRDPRRQNRGLLRAAVVVVLEVDRVLFDVAHHLERERGHFRLGVARGGGALVTGGSEVSLAERHRIAHGPRLHEAHEGVVDRAVAVRVVLAHHVADDARALRERLVGAVAAVVHRVDHATVHGLQAVAHIGEGATDDHAHRVVEVTTLHLLLEINLIDAAVVVALIDVGAFFVSHVCISLSALDQMSRKRTSFALRWMKLRRDSTSSPMRTAKISSAAAASSIVTCWRVRVSGFIVVSHSSSAFISPRPL
jgi:hypothetical protein